jgi:hypothetical protein
MSKTTMMLTLLVLVASCSPRPAKETPGGADQDLARDTAPTQTVRDPLPASPAAESSDTRPVAEKPVPRPPVSTPGPAVAPSVTVDQLLRSQDWNGKTVTVSGTCLGYRVPPVAVGNPPRTRSDWQLESGGVAIYVTGPLPPGCSAATGGTSPGTITALVQEDTLRALGPNPAKPRRYLEWKGQ